MPLLLADPVGRVDEQSHRVTSNTTLLSQHKATAQHEDTESSEPALSHGGAESNQPASQSGVSEREEPVSQDDRAESDDADSDVSEDGSGYLIPEDEMQNEIRMRTSTTKRQSIRALFDNTDVV